MNRVFATKLSSLFGPIALAVFFLAVGSSGCDRPSRSADTSWPQIGGFSHATLPGATGFRAQYQNHDDPSFIFSYGCPGGTTRNSAFDDLKGVFTSHNVYRETEQVLELRHEQGGDSGQRAGVTFVFDSARLVMTVLLINQENCLRLHPWLLERAMELHREYAAD